MSYRCSFICPHPLLFICVAKRMQPEHAQISSNIRVIKYASPCFSILEPKALSIEAQPHLCLSFSPKSLEDLVFGTPNAQPHRQDSNDFRRGPGSGRIFAPGLRARGWAVASHGGVDWAGCRERYGGVLSKRGTHFGTCVPAFKGEAGRAATFDKPSWGKWRVCETGGFVPLVLGGK